MNATVGEKTAHRTPATSDERRTQISERLHQAEHPEPVATQMIRQNHGDRGRLGCLSEPDAHTGQNECDAQHPPHMLVPREHGVRADIHGTSGAEHDPGAEPIGELSPEYG